MNGEVAVQDGVLTKADEKELLAQLRAAMPEFQEYTLGRGGEPAVRALLLGDHPPLLRADLGIMRWASDRA